MHERYLERGVQLLADAAASKNPFEGLTVQATPGRAREGSEHQATRPET